MGFCAEGDPRNRGSIRPGRGGPPGDLCPGTLQRIEGGSAWSQEHPPAGEAGGPGPARPTPDGPWELDGVLCNHSTLSRGSQGPSGIPDGRPLGLPPGGSDGCAVTGGETIRGGADSGTGGVPGTAGTSYATSGKDWGLAHGAAVHSQRDGARWPGMTRRPLPEVWPGSS